MDNRLKKPFIPSGSEANNEHSHAVRELTPDDLERVNGAGYSDGPEKKRRKLEEGKQ